MAEPQHQQLIQPIIQTIPSERAIIQTIFKRGPAGERGLVWLVSTVNRVQLASADLQAYVNVRRKLFNCELIKLRRQMNDTVQIPKAVLQERCDNSIDNGFEAQFYGED